MGLSFATSCSAEVGGGEVVDVGDEGDTVDVCGEGEVGDATLHYGLRVVIEGI